MPARIKPRNSRSLSSAHIRIKPVLIILTTLLLCLLFASCQAPLGGLPARKADLSFTFVISGVRHVSRGAEQLDAGSAQSRLILPTAASLSISLQPETGGDSITYGPNAIDAGGSTVPVSLTAVPYGAYTIVAEAHDADGVLRFTQTATGLVVGPEAASVTLNLVPADATPLEAVAADDLDLAELPAGESLCYFIASGAELFAGRSVFFSALAPDTFIFLQAADGTLLSQGDGSSARLSTVALPAGQAAYLTVYNGGTEAQAASRAFPGPKMVEVPGGLEPSTGLSVVPFNMGATEVTQEQFQHVMGFNYSDAGSLGGDIPVGNVTMYDAMNFCNALSFLEGLEPVYSLTEISMFLSPYEQSVQAASYTADFTKNGYRLPTISERVWATRGGTTTLYYWGESLDNVDLYAWHVTNSANEFKPVGGKLPNGYGLYDITGNVYEWSWGSDDQAQPNPSRCGGTAREPLEGYQDVTARWEVGADQGGGNGYVDNGFRVVRGEIPSYTISYNDNEASSGTVPPPAAVSTGAMYTVAFNTGILRKSESGDQLPVRSWNTMADGSGTDYIPGVSVLGPVGEDIVLYARWWPYYAEGSTGPSGGTVFFVNPNAESDGWRYLEAAPLSQEISGPQWSEYTGALGGTETTIGSGLANTLWIAERLPILYPTNPISAAQNCLNLSFDYAGSTFDDWFLPSRDELAQMATALDGTAEELAKILSNYYWSSSEYDAVNAWRYYPYSALEEYNNKGYAGSNIRTRPVRRF